MWNNVRCKKIFLGDVWNKVGYFSVGIVKGFFFLYFRLIKSFKEYL